MVGTIQVSGEGGWRSTGVRYAVTIDGESAGVVKRGETIRHMVDPGDHQVEASVARRSGTVLRNKHSPARTITVGEAGTAALAVQLGPAYSGGPRDPDMYLVVLDSDDHSPRSTRTARAKARLVCDAIMAVALVASVIVRLAAPGHAVFSGALFGVAFVAALLAIRTRFLDHRDRRAPTVTT